MEDLKVPKTFDLAELLNSPDSDPSRLLSDTRGFLEQLSREYKKSDGRVPSALSTAALLAQMAGQLVGFIGESSCAENAEEDSRNGNKRKQTDFDSQIYHLITSTLVAGYVAGAYNTAPRTAEAVMKQCAPLMVEGLKAKRAVRKGAKASAERYAPHKQIVRKVVKSQFEHSGNPKKDDVIGCIEDEIRSKGLTPTRWETTGRWVTDEATRQGKRFRPGRPKKESTTGSRAGRK